MLREQEVAETDAAKAERIQQAKADADAALVAINSRPASSSVQTDKNIVQANAADSMELCSTAELVELFAEYTEADERHKATDYLISEVHFETDLGFDHPALLEVSNVSTPLARAVLGDSNEDYDLDALMSQD